MPYALLLHYSSPLVLLVALVFECEVPMTDVIAATRAAVKLGSAVAAFNMLANDEFVSIPCPNILGTDMNLWAKSGDRRPSWPSGNSLCSCEELVAFWVRSNVMVGNGAEAERVAMFREHGSEALSNMLGIEAATDVVGGSGWLCCPSYVVISTLLSSAHLCTYQQT